MARAVLLSIALAGFVEAAPQVFASAIPTADVQVGNTQALRRKAEQLFMLGNAARAAQGVKALEWDPALAAAALVHCQRMAAEGALSHQYQNEPDVDERAGAAGAHFSLVEENVAEGPYPDTIHQAWMNSPHHRENLLNADVDRVGIAVVARGDMLYAVADFSKSVTVLNPAQVEATVGRMLEANGVSVYSDAVAARATCAMDHGMPALLGNERPEFIMRWQDARLERLPAQLVERMATGKYPEAAVGSCPSNSASNSFTVYRVAVLLLKPVGRN